MGGFSGRKKKRNRYDTQCDATKMGRQSVGSRRALGSEEAAV